MVITAGYDQGAEKPPLDYSEGRLEVPRQWKVSGVTQCGGSGFSSKNNEEVLERCSAALSRVALPFVLKFPSTAVW